MSAQPEKDKFSQSAAVTRCRNVKEGKLKAQQAIAKLADEEATIFTATVEQTRHHIKTQLQEQVAIDNRQAAEATDAKISWERKDQLNKLIDKLDALKATIRFQQEAREREDVFKGSIRQKRSAFQNRLARLEQRQTAERNELLQSQLRMADTVQQIRLIELKSVKDKSKLAKMQKENEIKTRQAAVRQQKETDFLRDLQLLKAHQLEEINDLEIQNLEEIEETTSQHRMEEFELVTKHTIAEAEIEANFERQKRELLATKVLEKQLAAKVTQQRAQKKLLSAALKQQKLAAKTREKMILAENPLIQGSGGEVAEGEIGVDDTSEYEGTSDSRSEATSRSGMSTEDLFKEVIEEDESAKAELEKNMAVNASTNANRMLSESEKAIISLEQSANERLRNVNIHHKKLVAELRQQHRAILQQKTREHRRKMSDLLKDHEDEIEQIKVEQASMMNELMSAQVADDASAVEESLVSTLSSVLPYHIMMSFQRGINPQPDDYSCATILFCDIFDIHKLTATITPANTLKLINGIFPIFDKIVQRYSLLYKVESASEVYLVAGGITETSEKTAQEMSQFTAQILNCAKELQALAAQFNFSPFAGTHPVKLRFGIHSGPTCAGLVGTKVCKYGLFGDGINTATRVCGKSEPGKIQVTTEVIAALGEDDKFEFEERGDVEIKGKGVMTCFWLLD